MRIIILALIMLTAGFSYGQDPVVKLDATIFNDDTGKKLGGVTMDVYRDGKPFLLEQSASNGRVPVVDLPVGSIYTVFFKKSGYVTKMAKVDARYDYIEDLGSYTPMQFKASIFESVEDVDFSFLEKTPMIEYEMNQFGVLEYDKKKLNDMLKKIEDLKKKMEEKKEELEKEAYEKEKQEADFNAYIEAGDQAMKRKEYEKAIGQYELGLGIKPGDKPTEIKIQDAKIALEALRDKEQSQKDFSDKMNQGKAARGAEELEKALTLYKEASAIKPDEKLPKTYIAELEKEIADKKNSEAAFTKLVAEGDNAVGSENFDEGISKYEAALKLKQDAGVSAKLAEAKKKKADKEAALAADKENQDKYNQLIASADGAFDTENYEEARKKYEEALKMKPGEALPTSQIQTIDEILKKKADEQAANDKKEADYKRLMDEGKEKINQRTWDDAKAKYEEALALKPGDPAALAQIDLIAKEKEKEAGEAKVNAEYDAHMKEAKSLFDQKEYAKAKSEYNAASGIKPQEQAPKDEISKIDALLGDQAKAAEKEEQYTNMMAEGDAANGRKDYLQAIDRYEKALIAKPGDTNAQSKIDEVKEALDADKKIAEDQAKFDGFVAEAKKSFNVGDYDDAKLNYTNALGIKNDPVILEKINEIDGLIAKNQSEAETQKKYDAAIADAEAAEKADDLETAIAKYKAANSIKQDDYPQSKIVKLEEQMRLDQAATDKDTEFNNLVKDGDIAYDAKDYAKALDYYKNAFKVKPDPTITNKIKEVSQKLEDENKNADTQAQYDKKIVEANAAFDDENWDGARTLYGDAGRIKPTETYPEERIVEIEKRMKAESEDEAQRQYQKIIDKADALLESDDLDESKGYYERALGIKKTDTYAQGQIDKIEQIKKDRENVLADDKKLNEDYTALIKGGEVAMDADEWQPALDKFNAALVLKPGESYPTNKIAEIKSKMNAKDLEKQKEAEYLATITRADQEFTNKDYQSAIATYNEALKIKPGDQYSTDKIASAENMLKQLATDKDEAAYQQLLADAQSKFDLKEYDAALSLYQNALSTKPTDPLPQTRIDEIKQIQLKAGASDEQEKEYEALILEADNLFEQREWKTAKDSYLKAFNIFNRTWPEAQIKLCNDGMQAETDSTLNKSYDKLIKKANDSFDAADYTKAKSLYGRAIGFKPNDQYPKDRIKEIEAILNPQVIVKTKTNMTNYGNPNRGTNSVDVAKMLADAEAQRKFNDLVDVEQQGLDAADATKEDTDSQKDENYKTREYVVKTNEQLDATGIQPNKDLVIASEFVEVMVDDQAVVDRDRVETNENDIQLQNQIVNNINLELEESDDASDIPREGYLLDVEQIRSEIILENQFQDLTQTNDTYKSKAYVTAFEENRIESDPKRDIPRLNTEIHVEDHEIDIINETNTNSWDQEDVVMEVKNDTELLIDEIAVIELMADLPREIGEVRIEEANIARVGVEAGMQDDQYDVTIDQKKYTENIINEIEIENLNNDIPREKMEGFVEVQRIENADKVEALTVDQNNALFATENDVEKMEIELDENRVEDDVNREGYEVVVDKIKEDKEEYLGIKTADTEDESHSTVNYLEESQDDQEVVNKELDEAADEVIDNTADMLDGMVEEEAELGEKSEESLDKTEDYVESLKDIDVTKIDEQMKNDLGDQFPEGMTEEIYTLNDDDGLMVSYVVRRIVVRNGAGNVYEMVQTKFGTVSYTCNGNGISEYDWQDQTEDANLVRN
ncbi:MAG: epidermal growth factor receptor substrate 15 [Crocinitomix sp.]|jgi:epidermal growth factor receptor substrate 15